jgi:hypothetical protein
VDASTCRLLDDLAVIEGVCVYENSLGVSTRNHFVQRWEVEIRVEAILLGVTIEKLAIGLRNADYLNIWPTNGRAEKSSYVTVYEANHTNAKRSWWRLGVQWSAKCNQSSQG